MASDIQPRVHRGATFAVLRAVSNVVLRDLNVTFVMDAMRAGRPSSTWTWWTTTSWPTTRGPSDSRPCARWPAWTGPGLAPAGGRLGAARLPDRRRVRPRPDPGATFKDRYGTTLADVIRELMGGAA